MKQPNKAIIRRWFDQLWNKHNEAVIDELIAPTGHTYGFPRPESVLTGPVEFKIGYRKFMHAFSGIEFQLDRVSGEGDSVAATWTATMTHTGGDLGVPPTGKQVKLSGTSYMDIHDGKITRGWNHVDLDSLNLQLETPA